MTRILSSFCFRLVRQTTNERIHATDVVRRHRHRSHFACYANICEFSKPRTNAELHFIEMKLNIFRLDAAKNVRIAKTTSEREEAGEEKSQNQQADVCLGRLICDFLCDDEFE